MKSINAYRFALWVAAVIIGCVALLSGSHFAATMILGLSSVLLITRKELSTPVSAKNKLAIILFILAWPLLILVTNSIWSKAQIERVLTNPVVVIPLWSLIVLATFRKWRRERTEDLSSQLD